jgi:cyclopropane fatty-acyl-phospholipid synthase-like methyltransferase
MKKFIAGHFRKPRGLFGWLASKMMIKRNMQAYLNLIAAMELRGDEKLFEIGYGPGEGMRHILISTGCSIDGIDFSSLMRSKASKRNRDSIRSRRVTLFHGDILDHTTTSKYDAVFFVNVIYFWRDLMPYFDKIRNMLRDGGKICFYMADKDELMKMPFTATDIFSKHETAAVVKALENCGFDNIRYTTEQPNYFKGHCFIAVKKSR